MTSNLYVVHYACVGASYTVPEGTVYDSAQVFMDEHKGTLKEGSHRTWVNEDGATVLEPRPILVAMPLSKERRRKYLMGLVDGRVYTSCQMSERQVRLSFMPVMFGALQPSAEIRQEMMGSTEPPQPQEPPSRPNEPTWESLPEKPTPPTMVKPCKDMKLQWEWEDISAREWKAHLKEIAEENAARDADHRIKLTAWQEKEAAIETKRRVHRKAVRDWEQTCREWEAPDIQDEIDAWVKQHDRIFSLWGSQIGTIAATVGESDTAGRAINGYPVFWSCTIIHPDDWERIRTAADKEIERRESVVV